MDEISRYAVGIDIGTQNVRGVIAGIDGNGQLNVVGYAEVPNSGMRRGVVANLSGPGQAIDQMLGKMERMAGIEINAATISINGSNIVSHRAEGMIAVGANEHEINESDLSRVEDVALQGQVSPNHKVLEIVPLNYTLDGQTGIKDPLGMTGSRLEMNANIITTLTPTYENLCRAAEIGKVTPLKVVPAVMASASAVLNERQRENGVAVIDIGASTTSLAIFEENDLQYVGVVPVGSHHITNDLAVLLAVDTEIAEEIKRKFVTGNFGAHDDIVTLRHQGKDLQFERRKIDEVVEARLREILELVRRELKRSHYDRRLPEGIVLTGGGAKMRDIDKFVREVLQTSARVGEPLALQGVAADIRKPEYATAIGLVLHSAMQNTRPAEQKRHKNKKSSESFFKRVLGKF